jgi:hypothetical protein
MHQASLDIFRLAFGQAKTSIEIVNALLQSANAAV